MGTITCSCFGVKYVLDCFVFIYRLLLHITGLLVLLKKRIVFLSRVSMVVIEVVRTASSAYITVWHASCSQFSMSLVRKRNSTGRSTESLVVLLSSLLRFFLFLYTLHQVKR